MRWVFNFKAAWEKTGGAALPEFTKFAMLSKHIFIIIMQYDKIHHKYSFCKKNIWWNFCYFDSNSKFNCLWCEGIKKSREWHGRRSFCCSRRAVSMATNACTPLNNRLIGKSVCRRSSNAWAHAKKIEAKAEKKKINYNQMSKQIMSKCKANKLWMLWQAMSLQSRLHMIRT